MTKLVIGYFITVNIIGFLLMGIDKKKAIQNQWRIPEKSLFFCSILGGSIGTWAGMYAFRHKTKHWYFVIGMPLILFLQVAVAVFFMI